MKNPAYGRQSLSRPMRIVAPMPQEGGPRIPKNPIFLKNGKNHQKRNVQKYEKISDTPFDKRSLIHREAWFPPCFVGQRIPQNPFFLKKRKKSSKAQELKNVEKYAKISDIPFDQRSLIHREAWFSGGPRIPKNQIFLKNGKNHLNAKTLKRLGICQNQQYALLPEVSNPSGSVVSTMFCKAKSSKKTFFFAWRFQTTFKQKCSNVRPLLSLLFPKDSKSLKILNFQLREVGAKRRLNGTVQNLLFLVKPT